MQGRPGTGAGETTPPRPSVALETLVSPDSGGAALGAILRQISEAVVIADREGRITFVNEAAERLHATSLLGPAAAVGPASQQVLGEAREPVPTADLPLARAVAGEAIVEGRWWIRGPDGAELVVVGSASPIRDDSGALVGAILTARDDTARARAEAALRADENEARANAERVQLALAAGAIVGTWFWDLPSDRFTVDEQFARAFGLDPDAARQGLNLEQVIDTVHPDDKPGLRQAIDEAIARGGPYSHPYRVRRADGCYYWIEANGRVEHGPDGVPLAFPGVLLDLEQRRRVEEERDRALALLKMFTDAVPGVVYAKDREGRMLVGNRGTTALIGKPPDLYLGRTDAEFLDDTAQALDIMATDGRIMDSGLPEQVEEEVRRPDGARAVWLSTKEPLRDENGAVVGLIGSSIDITSWRRAEEARALLMREVDHRARNALATVQSVVRLSRGHDIQAFRDAVSGRVDALARAQASLSRSNWEGALLGDIVAEEIEASGYAQRFELDGPELLLRAEDVQAVSMIVHELVTNAIKYGALSSTEGRVSLRWTGSAAGWTLAWSEHGGPIVLPPAKSGFGSRLISRLADQLRGQARFTWLPPGVQVEVTSAGADGVAAPGLVPHTPGA